MDTNLDIILRLVDETSATAARIGSLVKQQMTGMSGSTDTVTASMKRMNDSLSGSRIIQDAKNIAAAVEGIGGAGKLTDAEMSRVNSTVTQALAKYKALGQEAPAHLQALAEATSGVGKTTSSSLLGSIPVVESFVAAFSVERIYEFGKGIFESLHQLHDLSLATGISTTGLQQMAYAGVEFGLDMETIARGVEQLSRRLAGDDKSATSAVRMLGLDVRALQAAGPQEAFLTIAEAAGKVEDPMQKARLASELFGNRLAVSLLPALGDLRTKMDEAAAHHAIVAPEDVKAAAEFDVKIQHLTMSLKAYTIEAAKWLSDTIAPATPDVAKLNAGWSLGPEGGAHDIALPASATQATVSNAQLITNALTALRTQALAPLSAEQRAQILQLKEWGQGEAEIAQLVGSNEVAVHRFIEADRQAAEAKKAYLKALADYNSVGSSAYDTIEKMNSATVEGIRYDLERGELAETLVHVYGVTAVQVKAIAQVMKDEAQSLTDTIKQIDESRKIGEQGAAAVAKGLTGLPTLKNLAIQMGDVELGSKQTAGYMGLVNDLSAQAAVHMAVLRDNTKQMQAFLKGGYEIIGLMPGKVAEIGEIALQTFDNISKSLEKGDLFGAVVAGAVGAAKAIKALFTGFGGPSDAEVAGRKLEATFEESFGGFDQMMAAVGAAYTATGRTLQQAQADVKGLLAAEKQGPAAVQAWIDKINSVFDAEKAKAAAVSAGVDSILSAAKNVGTNFPAALKPMVDQLLALPGLTDDEKKSLLGLVDAAKPSVADLTNIAQKYGVTLEGLGAKTAQLSISARADEIETDFKTITEAGGDAGGILHAMADKVSALVDDALKYGSVLPTALKPLVDELERTGQLTDENGKKLTDLSGLKFDDTGDPLANGLKTLTKTIQDLIDLLSNKVPGAASAAASGITDALNRVPKDFTVTGHFDLPDLSGDTWRTTDNAAATGAIVTATGLIHTGYYAKGGPVGTDTVNAWLSPNELVLSIAQKDAAASWIAAAQSFMVSVEKMPKVIDDLWAAKTPTLTTWPTVPPAGIGYGGGGSFNERGPYPSTPIPSNAPPTIENHFHYSPTVQTIDAKSTAEWMDKQGFPAFLDHVQKNSRQSGMELVDALPIDWEKL